MRPLAGRGIAATNTTTGEIFSTFTLNDGSFVLGRLTAGTYEFTVPDAEITQVTPSVVELLEGEALTGVLIDIDAGTGLTGSITNESGETVPGAAVYLFDGNTVVDFDSADEDGAYAFEGLGPGTFTMAVDTPGLARTWVTDLDTTSGNVNVDV